MCSIVCSREEELVGVTKKQLAVKVDLRRQCTLVRKRSGIRQGWQAHQQEWAMPSLPLP